MASPPVRVVYDCNIFVQALINPKGPAGRCVAEVQAGRAILFVSAFILDEVRESYRKIPAKYGVTSQQAETLATALAALAAVVDDVPVVFSYERDPDDAHYVNVALAAKARLVVSRDRDLLDLMDSARSAAAASFRARFPDLRILEPVAFLRELDAASA
jgi:uncharacterized protein